MASTIAAPKRTNPDRDDGSDPDAADDHENHEPACKAKRHDIEVPMAPVDIKLAEHLDHVLRLSDTRKPRFFMNRLRASNTKATCDNGPGKVPAQGNEKSSGAMQHKNLTKDQLKRRLAEKYETLVPELDPKRTVVKLVKILSATESLEMGKEQARKQLEHQLGLSSVGGNQQANRDGIQSFRFRDGYELPPKCFHPGKKSTHPLKPKSVSFASNETGLSNGVMATVKYFKPDANEASSSDSDDSDINEDVDDDEDEDYDDDDAMDEVYGSAGPSKNKSYLLYDGRGRG